MPKSLTASIQHLRSSGGQPLSAGARDFFESRFGADLSAIRVHANSRAAAAARSAGASAFTVGGDVMFGAGEYQPNTSTGRRLLAHELTHAIQQSQSSKPMVLRSSPKQSRDPLITILNGGIMTSSDLLMLIRDLTRKELQQFLDDLTAERENWPDDSWVASTIDDAIVAVRDVLSGHTETVRAYCDRAVPAPDGAWFDDGVNAIRIGEKPAVRVGARGPVVKAIQQMLMHWGCTIEAPPRNVLPVHGPDKIFGTETRRAVREFQREEGLSVDGRVGPQTIGALDDIVYNQGPIDNEPVDDGVSPDSPDAYDQMFIFALFGESANIDFKLLLQDLTYAVEFKAIQAERDQIEQWLAAAEPLPTHGPAQKERAKQLRGILEANLDLASSRANEINKSQSLKVVFYTLRDTSLVSVAKTYVADGTVDEAWAIKNVEHVKLILDSVAARNGSGSIQTLYIIGHGTPGAYQFGTELVSASEMSGPNVAGSLSKAIKPGATVSFLGCSAAAGEEGREFIRAMGKAFLNDKAGKLVGNTDIASGFGFDITPNKPVTYKWPSMDCSPKENCPEPQK